MWTRCVLSAHFHPPDFAKVRQKLMSLAKKKKGSKFGYEIRTDYVLPFQRRFF